MQNTLIILGIIGGVVSLIQLALWAFSWRENRIDKFDRIERHGVKLLDQIKESDFKPDFVLGLGRSGALMGGWLAGNLGSVAIEVIDRVHQDQLSKTMTFPHIEEKLRLLKAIYGDSACVLVVEGAVTRGGTFQQFEILRKSLAPEWKCEYCALYEVDTSAFTSTFVGRYLKKAPTRYPWHTRADYKKYLRLARKRPE